MKFKTGEWGEQMVKIPSARPPDCCLKSVMHKQDLAITVTGEWRKKEVQSRHELATYRDVLMSPLK